MAEPPRLFLSYARGDDEPFVKRLYKDLTAKGLNVWWDRVAMPSRALTFLQEIRNLERGAETPSGATRAGSGRWPSPRTVAGPCPPPMTIP
jgi:hypothetical protein